MSYTITRLDKERVKDIATLFAASGKSTANYRKFEKKYDTGYTGAAYIGYLAYAENGQPAAFYGVLPVLARQNGEPVLVAQSADTITHPDHQRKGLFAELALKTYALAASEGVEFLYGIPNSLSYPGFVNKLGWQHKGHMQRYVIPVMNLPFGAFSRRYKLAGRLHQRYAGFVLSFYRLESAAGELFGPGERTHIPRNQPYRDYKSYMPKHLVSVSGVTCWFSLEGHLKIGDFETAEVTDSKRFIRKLKRIAFLLGVHKIVFECSAHSGKNAFFKDLVPVTEGLPFICRDLSGRYDPEALTITLADIDTF